MEITFTEVYQTADESHEYHDAHDAPTGALPSPSPSAAVFPVVSTGCPTPAGAKCPACSAGAAGATSSAGPAKSSTAFTVTGAKTCSQTAVRSPPWLAESRDAI